MSGELPKLYEARGARLLRVCSCCKALELCCEALREAALRASRAVSMAEGAVAEGVAEEAIRGDDTWGCTEENEDFVCC